MPGNDDQPPSLSHHSSTLSDKPPAESKPKRTPLSAEQEEDDSRNASPRTPKLNTTMSSMSQSPAPSSRNLRRSRTSTPTAGMAPIRQLAMNNNISGNNSRLRNAIREAGTPSNKSRRQTSSHQSVLNSTTQQDDPFVLVLPPPPSMLESRINPYLDSTTVIAPTLKLDPMKIVKITQRLSNRPMSKEKLEHQLNVLEPHVAKNHSLQKTKVMSSSQISDAVDRLCDQEMINRETRDNNLKNIHLQELQPKKMIDGSVVANSLQKLYYRPLEKTLSRHPPKRPASVGGLVAGDITAPSYGKVKDDEEEEETAATGGGGDIRNMSDENTRSAEAVRFYDDQLEKQRARRAKLEAKYVQSSLPKVKKMKKDAMSKSVKRLYENDY